MTYNEKISDTVHDGAEAVNDAAKSLYEKALDTVYDGAEAVNHAVKEQWAVLFCLELPQSYLFTGFARWSTISTNR